MNKRNNKGFSLIELIVVVAIMAVLVGVLAPTYLRYVEKTRLQKDNSAIAEVAQAMKVAAAEEKINTAISGDSDKTVTITASGAKFTFTKTEQTGDTALTADELLVNELVAVIGTELELKSNTYKEAASAASGATNVAISIKIENGIPAVTGVGVIEETDGVATTADAPKKY